MLRRLSRGSARAVAATASLALCTAGSSAKESAGGAAEARTLSLRMPGTRRVAASSRCRSKRPSSRQ
jgi:hypothetical protein